MVLKQKDDALKSFKNLTRLPERVDSSFQSIQKDTTLDGFQVIEEKQPPIDPQKIFLKKTFYGRKEALSLLDEEFNFFNIKRYNIKEFFDLYNSLFFNLKVDTHKEFMSKSINYVFPDGYQNFQTIEKQDLLSQLRELQREIDSVEREDFFFKNGSFLMDELNFESSTNKIDSGESIYYMQSGKKRKILNFQIYLNLKQRIRKQQEFIQDKDFIAFISTATLNSVPEGPPINKLKDIYLSAFEINIYPRTLENYEPDFEGSEIEVLTSDYGIESNTREQ